MHGRFLQLLRVLAISLLFVCTLGFALDASAQQKWSPQKQIEIVTGYSPGGPTDVGTRILAEELKNDLKVPIVVEYKPGAGGGVANMFVIRANPDGYTLYSTYSNAVVGIPALEKKPSFDPTKDLTPIALWSVAPNVLVTNSSSKLTSFEAMVKFAKENPGKLTLATPGVATMGHFLVEYFKKYGIQITHVPAKGASPALTNILGGHVDLAFFSYPPLSAHIRSGALRLLAVTSKFKEEPNARTLVELGFPESTTFETWQGFFGPAHLPPPVFERLTSTFGKVIQMPSMVQALEKAGFTPAYKGPEALTKQMNEEFLTMRKIGEAAGMIK